MSFTRTRSAYEVHYVAADDVVAPAVERRAAGPQAVLLRGVRFYLREPDGDGGEAEMSATIAVPDSEGAPGDLREYQGDWWESEAAYDFVRAALAEHVHKQRSRRAGLPQWAQRALAVGYSTWRSETDVDALFRHDPEDDGDVVDSGAVKPPSLDVAEVALERAQQQQTAIRNDPASTGTDRREADLAVRHAQARVQEAGGKLPQETDDGVPEAVAE